MQLSYLNLIPFFRNLPDLGDGSVQIWTTGIGTALLVAKSFLGKQTR